MDKMQSSIICSACRRFDSFGPVTKSSAGYLCERYQSGDKLEELCVIYEIVAQKFVFACKYKFQDCDVVFPFGDGMKQHEMCCLKRAYPCPPETADYSDCENHVYFSAYECPMERHLCEWRGLMRDLQTHFHDKHKVEDSRVTVCLEDLKASRKTTFFYLMKAKVNIEYVQFFRVCIELRQRGEISSVRMVVQYVGEVHKANQYVYSVAVYDGSRTQLTNANCQPYSSKDIFKNSECLEFESNVKKCAFVFKAERKFPCFNN